MIGYIDPFSRNRSMCRSTHSPQKTFYSPNRYQSNLALSTGLADALKTQISPRIPSLPVSHTPNTTSQAPLPA